MGSFHFNLTASLTGALISSASVSSVCPTFYNQTSTGTSSATAVGPNNCTANAQTSSMASSAFSISSTALSTLNFTILSADITNTIQASAGFDQLLVVSGGSGSGNIQYSFSIKNLSSVEIIVNSATANLRLSQNGAALQNGQVCSYVLNFPLPFLSCMAPIMVTAPFTFGQPFDLAAAFSANASGLDFYPLSATGTLTYSISDGSGQVLPSAILVIASTPEPSAAYLTLGGAIFLIGTVLSKSRTVNRV